MTHAYRLAARIRALPARQLSLVAYAFGVIDTLVVAGIVWLIVS